MTRYRKIAQKKSPLPLLLMGIGGVFLILAAVLILTPGDSATSSTDFSLPDLQGKTVSVSDYKGDVVLVNLWATWCPPCKAEMPVLQDYYDTFKDQGFVVLAINDQESQTIAQAFILDYGYTFPVLVDPAGNVSRQFNITSLPTTIVFDRDGKIVYRHTGMLTAEILSTEVTTLIMK